MQEAREKTHLVDISKGVTESLKITPFAVANWIDQRARNESPSLVGQEFKDYTDLLYQGGFPEIPPHIIRRLSEFIAKAWNEQDRNATRCYLEFIGAEPWVDEGRWIRYITTEFNEPNEAFKELVALSKPELLRDMEDQDFIAFRGNAVPLKMTSTRTFLDFTESERDDRPAPQYFDMHDIGIVNNPFEPLGNQVETMEFEEGTIDTPMLIITKKIIDAIEQYHVTR